MKTPRIHIYQDASGQWRWRLQARNSRVIADSGEGYSERRHAIRAAIMLKKVAPVAVIHAA